MSKLVNDALVIAWLNALRYTRPPLALVANMVLFPLPMPFLARYLVPEGIPVSPRLIAGSIVFSVGLNSVNNLVGLLTLDRFTYRLTLIRAQPVHRLSYAAGMLIAGTARAVVNACVLLLFAPLFGIDIHLNLWFLPVTALTAVSLSGLALVISTWTPSWEVGEMLGGVGLWSLRFSPTASSCPANLPEVWRSGDVQDGGATPR